MVLVRRTESGRRGGRGPRPVFGRDGCEPETAGEERAGAGLDQRAVEVPVVGGGLPRQRTTRTKEAVAVRARGVGLAGMKETAPSGGAGRMGASRVKEHLPFPLCFVC